jgi:hypothetical protein
VRGPFGACFFVFQHNSSHLEKSFFVGHERDSNSCRFKRSPGTTLFCIAWSTYPSRHVVVVVTLGCLESRLRVHMEPHQSCVYHKPHLAPFIRFQVVRDGPSILLVVCWDRNRDSNALQHVAVCGGAQIAMKTI